MVDLSENFTGAEIEETVQSGLWKAFEESDEAALEERHLEAAAQETVPLVTTMSEQIGKMRDWATRARPASDNQSTGRPRQTVGGKTRSAVLET